MAILYGVGRPLITTKVDQQEVLMPVEPMAFQLQPAVDVVKSTKFAPDGTVVFAGSAKRSKNWSLTLGVQAITWAVVQFALGELATLEAANVDIGELRFGYTPATGTMEVADAAITAGMEVLAAIYGDDKPRFLKRVTSATPSFGEFTVAAGKITLGGTAAQVGKQTIGYRMVLGKPNVESLGVANNPTLLNGFAFEGYLATDGPPMLIRIPQLRSTTEPTVNVQGVTQFDLGYDLINPSGKIKPFELYRIPA